MASSLVSESLQRSVLSASNALLVAMATIGCANADQGQRATGVVGGGSEATGTTSFAMSGGNAAGGSIHNSGGTTHADSTNSNGGAGRAGDAGQIVGTWVGGTSNSASFAADGGTPAVGGTALVATAGPSTKGGTNSSGGSRAIGGLSGRGGSMGGGSPLGSSAGMAAAVAGTAGTSGNRQPTNCLAFWNFDTVVDGKVPDTSGHNLPMTLSQTTLTAGPRGNYLKLAGANTYAAAPSPVIDTKANFSLSVWVKLDQLDSYATIVSQDGQNVSSFYLQKRNSGRFALATFPDDSIDATGCITEGAVQPRVGEWYHLVATRNAATREQRLYVDGMLSGRSTCAGGFTTTSPLVVGRGRWQAPVDWVSGGVDELCVQDRVLTPEQAVDVYLQGRSSATNYLFAYFAEQAQGRGDGLRLAQSHDALYWGAVGSGKVFLPPTVGGKSFRDPHLMRDPKGTYHLVWTTSCVPWAESGCMQDKGFGYAQSDDLVHFNAPSYIPVALNVEHVWAPETIFDSALDQYMVYWSSPLDNDPNSADPHSIYYMLTKDFVNFSAPSLLYTRSGRNFIDATIAAQQAGGYLMFLKDEANGQKNIRSLASNSLYGAGAWASDPSTPLTGNYAAEGPSALVVEGQIYLFFDKYADGTYGALRSSSLSNLTTPSAWTDISSSVFFAGVRHGTPIEVPSDVYRAVALKAGE